MFCSSSSTRLALLLILIFVYRARGGSGHTPTRIGKGYKLVSIETTPEGCLLGHLRVKHKNTLYGPDISHLQLFVKHETEDRLRVHITDAKKQRWEVPYNLLPREPPHPLKKSIGRSRKNPVTETELSGSDLVFTYTADPFGFAVKRKSDRLTLFNSSSDESDPFGPMVFKDQYLEISTRLPNHASLYGLGENTQPDGIKLRPNDPYTLYATDVAAFNLNTDLYGSHPFYIDLRNVRGSGHAHGVLLLNSNGMDVAYRRTSLTYKVIGGVFDFYFFSGPSPLDVVRQYTSLIGRPAPMPYWSLGFHQCKWGYHNLSVVEDVVAQYRKSQIPLDVIWNDDDHMDAHKDFTLSPQNYPRQNVIAFLDKIHNLGMKYIVIVDPGIAVNSSYGVYERGIANDVFINYHGQPYLAQVWPGPVHFPDFLNPKTADWWADEIRRFHALVPIDGLWIDMNEASNFCSGLCKIPTGKKCPNGSGPGWVCCLDCKNITATKFDDPPYKINASGSQAPIGFKTIATSAIHYNGILEYDAHSLYGFSQSIVTYNGLVKMLGKRPFILSRSTFVGSGKYVAHWTGDNKGTWKDLRHSISTVLNFGIFGVPMVGADICGFYPSPTEELCTRWIELGAFYPFSRDHANFYSPRQELYQWNSVAKSARNALGMRYRLLPYLYTLSYEAHVSGAPIARALFFSFPNFPQCYGTSTQFMLGNSVMVSPVLRKGKSNVRALFPPGSWYNLFNMSQATVVKNMTHRLLDAPLHVINVHVYQNTILPMQQGGLTSKEARVTPFTLIVSFPAGVGEGNARGNVFVDDDELPEMKLGNKHATYVDFYASLGLGKVKVWSEVKEGEFALRKGWKVEKVIVLGLVSDGKPSEVEINGKLMTEPLKMEFKVTEQVLLENDEEELKISMVDVNGLDFPIGKNFSVSWKF